MLETINTPSQNLGQPETQNVGGLAVEQMTQGIEGGHAFPDPLKPGESETSELVANPDGAPVQITTPGTFDHAPEPNAPKQLTPDQINDWSL